MNGISPARGNCRNQAWAVEKLSFCTKQPKSPIEPLRLDSLKEDKDFIEATQKSTTDKSNVVMRLARAKELVTG
jgi:hypothetical protein